MTRFVPLLIFVAGLAVGSWLLVGGGDTESDTTVDDAPAAFEPVTTTLPPEPMQSAPADVSTAPNPAATAAPIGDCLSPQEVMAQSFDAVAKLGPMGPDVDALLGVDEAGLMSLAEQEDSAAMAMLAVRNIMKAKGLSPDDAASLFNSSVTPTSQLSSALYLDDTDFSPNQMLDLQEANYWLYQSALRGRLVMLSMYGNVIGKQFGGPVGLGWLPRERYDAMDSRLQNLFAPKTVYGFVAQRYLLDLGGQEALDAMPEEDRETFDALVERLYQKFAADIEAYPAAFDVINDWNEEMAEIQSSACEAPDGRQ